MRWVEESLVEFDPVVKATWWSVQERAYRIPVKCGTCRLSGDHERWCGTLRVGLLAPVKCFRGGHCLRETLDNRVNNRH